MTWRYGYDLNRYAQCKRDDLRMQKGGIMMDWFDQLTDGLICCGPPVFPTPRGLRGNRYRNPSSPDGPNLVFPPEKGSSTHIRLLQTTHFAEDPFSLNEARLCFVGISSEMRSPPLQKKRERAFPLLLKRKERRALEIQISSTHGYKLWRYRPATQIFWPRIDEKNDGFFIFRFIIGRDRSSLFNTFADVRLLTPRWSSRAFFCMKKYV